MSRAEVAAVTNPMPPSSTALSVCSRCQCRLEEHPRNISCFGESWLRSDSAELDSNALAYTGDRQISTDVYIVTIEENRKRI